MVSHHRKGCDQKNRQDDQEDIHWECGMGSNTTSVYPVSARGFHDFKKI